MAKRQRASKPTMEPRTEPEKEGSANRTATSSLPRRSCSLTPALLYTLSLTHPTPHLPVLTFTSPPHLVIISSKVPKREERRKPNVQSLLVQQPLPPPPHSPRRSSSCYLRPRNMMQKLKTKLKSDRSQRVVGDREPWTCFERDPDGKKKKHRRKLENKEKSRFTLQK